MSADGDNPAAAELVIDVCLPSWNGRIAFSTPALAMAALSVLA
jgi:hypothetical protein